MRREINYAISIARDLHYDRYMPEVYDRLGKATSEADIAEALHECRRRWNEADYAALGRR